MTNRKQHISKSTTLTVTKFDRVVPYDMGSPPAESCDTLITPSSEVAGQVKKVVFFLETYDKKHDRFMVYGKGPVTAKS